MRLVMLGPPGSGKGTQSAALQERYSVPQISTGDMFREAVTEGTELGKKAKEYIEAGELVPDELAIGIVEERLRKEDGAHGFLLDGFPRTTVQAKMLDKMLLGLEAELDGVILIRVPEEELIARLSGRRICEACGAVFHVANKPPAAKGVCDICGGQLIQRPDDSEETVRERLRVYEENTKPLIEYYEKRGILAEVDGIGPVKQVFDRISRAL